MFDGKEKNYPDWKTPGGKKPPPKTSHTLAPVPFIIFGKGSEQFRLSNLPEQSLGNVAATVIDLLGLNANPIYLPSLVTRKSTEEKI
jgi:bisphosphoglycerate-independent phosphoglycerate mutase (AlkP superfamily)